MARASRARKPGSSVTRKRRSPSLARLNMDQMSRRTLGLGDREWVHSWIQWYGVRRPRYVVYSRILEAVLKAGAKRHAPLAIVQTRAKDVAGYAGKLQRQLTKYRQTDDRGRLKHPLTDLCGGRVITHTLTQMKVMCQFVEEHFDVDEANSVDVATRLQTSQFGYRSVHYIVRFKPGVFPRRGVPIGVPRSLYGLDAEIQIRTLLEHTWADIEHDVCYKNSFKVPEKWEREYARLAAILEDADDAFCRIEYELSAYAANYEAYMSKEQVREEIAKAEVILGVDPQNAEVAHRIARLAMCVGDWAKVVRTLSPFVGLEMPPLLRDLGIAKCKRSKRGGRTYSQGQKLLERAIELAPTDSDAMASLGGTWRGLDDEKAMGEANPTDPYPLGNYLVYEIARREDLSSVAFAKPSIDAAIERCRDQADVGMNMPWAFYDMGKFELLLNRPYKSLACYAKAVACTTSKGMIESSLANIRKLAVVGSELQAMDWVDLFLVLAAARFPTGRPPRRLASRAGRRRRPVRGPVVLVTGACSKDDERHMAAYGGMLLRAFKGFRGTVISGGTKYGVARLVGDIGAAYRGDLRTLGYVPYKAVADRDKRRYHEIRETKTDDFSPLEPLQAWADVLASDIPADQVKLLAIGGGDISAVECRIALALGATVGVLQGSGRAASRLLDDPDWQESAGLLTLPADAMTVHEFIRPSAPQLPEGIRQTMGKAIHEEYLKGQEGKIKSEQPSLAEWDKLLGHLKESNCQQADHIRAKLERLGYTIRKVKKGKPVRVRKLGRRQIEIMAEWEHGRWNVERIVDGWSYGPKDVDRKISPYLKPWAELPEDIKDYDRDTVSKIPEFLAEVGLEIHRT
ncbi:hypothetical protein LCGC14_1476420 [marine sediment metagenome]|uniref:RelA/SpoT domain-containing protein n=1 Tax=marine sediment metagenome TaxID=412755 RepID=A0A0F9LRB6_9ZZZZ